MHRDIILFSSRLMERKTGYYIMQMTKQDEGCGLFRSPRAQKFIWNKDGTPNFGEPVKEGIALNVPSE